MADVRWRLLALIVVVTATKTWPKNQNRLINQNRPINQNQPIDQNQLIDQKRLAEIVEQVIKRLHLERRDSERNLSMFSLAVNVPGLNGVYHVNAIPDPGDKIRKDLLRYGVYQDKYVLAATVLKAKCRNRNQNVKVEHAEYRVLRRFKAWAAKKPKNQTGLMLFYVFASPCPDRCASNDNNMGRSILPLLKDITEWPQHALVFSKVFKPKMGRPINEGELIKALKNLGSKLGGLENIFRCERVNQHMKCDSCSRGGGDHT
ncbi:uncharacterized protein LOC133562088 [Nerophis ophidion]|uniref:uncharacterized protein LOC133562088 n=1 Tax=Nerophis ophidion TaxID=159077 RepID=UPI002ADF976A|nr:uncharacterized protein LOC133562088 [Nerophis ophidion]